MLGNAKFAVSFVETVAILWGHVYFICFFKEVQTPLVFYYFSAVKKREWTYEYQAIT